MPARNLQHLPRRVDTRRPLDRDAAINQGVVARWKCVKNWMGGPTWMDLGGRSPGTLSGATPPAWRPATRPGGAGHLAFDGSSSYVSLPSIFTQPTITIACWINPDSVVNSNGGGIFNQNLLNNVNFVLLSSSLFVFFGGAAALSSGGVVAAGKWQHVAWTVAAGTSRLYVDGRLVDTTTGMSTSAPAAGPAAIGFWSNQSDPTRYFQGGLDDFIAYDGRALSDAEVAGLHQAGRSRSGAQGLAYVDPIPWAGVAAGAPPVVFPWATDVGARLPRVTPTVMIPY